MFKHILFIFFLIGSGYYYWTTRPVMHGPGEVAPKEPRQKNAFGVKPIKYKTYTLSPLAAFDAEARVLSKKRYYNDRVASIAPYDFVLGWGPMSDERNLGYLLIKQSNRSFYWEMTRPPIPEQEMRQHTANIRLIPSNQKIREQLGNIRQGHIIKVQGYLVKIRSDDGWQIKSSLSRKDRGKNSAEVVWIEEFRIL